MQGSGGDQRGRAGALSWGLGLTSGQSHLSHVASCSAQDGLAARVEPPSTPPPSLIPLPAPKDPYCDPGGGGVPPREEPLQDVRLT